MYLKKDSDNGYMLAISDQPMDGYYEISEKEYLRLMGYQPELSGASIDVKLKAQQERIEFLEDCIAEMAMEIYK